jgi:magnesium chelatase subunit D
MALPEFPLAAVAGCAQVKLALSLLAVDPLLKGIVIRGGRGSGKSTLARGIRELLPEGTPFVEVPPSVTIDRLAGLTDWTGALSGRRSGAPVGLLERANGGAIFSDHANLLPLAVIARIAAALNGSGSFVWLAAYDPGEGEPPPLLADALGLWTEADRADSAGTRETVARTSLEFQSAPNGFVTRFAAWTAREAERIRAARQSLGGVRVDRELVRRLCELASEAGVEGNRAEVFSLRTARAHAALCGRRYPDETDLGVAKELAIAPRSSTCRETIPADRAVSSRPTAGRQTGGADSQPIPAPPIDTPAPPLSCPARLAGRSASGGGRARQRAESDAERGRYSGALQRDPGHGAVAVDATLRAAAPFQKLRERDGRRIRIVPGDLRYKRFRRKNGVGIVIALDASGSMAANRIQQAKGAVIRLLRDAYVHRDSVALIAFRGARADRLMKLGRSVELARRALDDLPAGGGTPLASGILCALEEARSTAGPALLVVLTDGRPNVAMTGAPVWDELERVAAGVRQSRCASVVIDTCRGRPAAGRLAELLGAQYLSLPHMDAGAVHRCVAEAAAAMR